MGVLSNHTLNPKQKIFGSISTSYNKSRIYWYIQILIIFTLKFLNWKRSYFEFKQNYTNCFLNIFIFICMDNKGIIVKQSLLLSFCKEQLLWFCLNLKKKIKWKTLHKDKWICFGESMDTKFFFFLPFFSYPKW